MREVEPTARVIYVEPDMYVEGHGATRARHRPTTPARVEVRGVTASRVPW